MRNNLGRNRSTRSLLVWMTRFQNTSNLPTGWSSWMTFKYVLLLVLWKDPLLSQWDQVTRFFRTRLETECTGCALVRSAVITTQSWMWTQKLSCLNHVVWSEPLLKSVNMSMLGCLNLWVFMVGPLGNGKTTLWLRCRYLWWDSRYRWLKDDVHIYLCLKFAHMYMSVALVLNTFFLASLLLEWATSYTRQRLFGGYDFPHPFFFFQNLKKDRM